MLRYSQTRVLRAAAVALFIMPALEGAAAAGPLNEAHAADQRGDYATELRLLHPLAERGNAEAQTALASCTMRAMAFRKTTWRRPSGTVAPLTKVSLTRKMPST